MAKFTLIRHGESVWNGERRMQGHQDPDLSARGRRQSDLLVARFHAPGALRAAAVYTSPLRRAAETGERLAGTLALPLFSEPDFREMSLGRWEGMTVSEIRAAFPGSYQRWLEDPRTFPAPGGEGLDAFARRVVRAFERVQAAHPGADVIILSHGGVIKALLCYVLGVDLRALFRIKQDNTAVSQIEVTAVSRRVLLVNDTCHLSQGGTDLVPRDVLIDPSEGTDPAF